LDSARPTESRLSVFWPCFGFQPFVGESLLFGAIQPQTFLREPSSTYSIKLLNQRSLNGLAAVLESAPRDQFVNLVDQTSVESKGDFSLWHLNSPKSMM
jgi:hypothetical protein